MYMYHTFQFSMLDLHVHNFVALNFYTLNFVLNVIFYSVFCMLNFLIVCLYRIVIALGIGVSPESSHTQPQSGYTSCTIYCYTVLYMCLHAVMS